MFHVVCIVKKTGAVIPMTKTPVSHKDGCTIMSKLTQHPHRSIELRPV